VDEYDWIDCLHTDSLAAAHWLRYAHPRETVKEYCPNLAAGRRCFNKGSVWDDHNKLFSHGPLPSAIRAALQAAQPHAATSAQDDEPSAGNDTYRVQLQAMSIRELIRTGWCPSRRRREWLPEGRPSTSGPLPRPHIRPSNTASKATKQHRRQCRQMMRHQLPTTVRRVLPCAAHDEFTRVCGTVGVIFASLSISHLLPKSQPPSPPPPPSPPLFHDACGDQNGALIRHPREAKRSCYGCRAGPISS
jgi:hypothetical protein